jgi:hypothetical protein
MMIEAEVQAGMYIIMCMQQCKLKLTNFGRARQSRDLEHEPTLQVGTDRFVSKYAYHKPITVKFLDKCEWQNGFKVDIKGGLALTRKGPGSIKGLVMECIGGAREGGIDSAVGSTPQYSRLKYNILRLVEWRI